MRSIYICERKLQMNVLIQSFHLSGHTFRFQLQENELSSVITVPTVPLDCAHPELSFEWSVTFRFHWTLFRIQVFSWFSQICLSCSFGSERVKKNRDYSEHSGIVRKKKNSTLGATRWFISMCLINNGNMSHMCTVTVMNMALGTTK